MNVVSFNHTKKEKKNLKNRNWKKEISNQQKIEQHNIPRKKKRKFQKKEKEKSSHTEYKEKKTSNDWTKDMEKLQEIKLNRWRFRKGLK